MPTFQLGANERLFLSIQAQDFIEERRMGMFRDIRDVFLSIQAQDFIEEKALCEGNSTLPNS